MAAEANPCATDGRRQRWVDHRAARRQELIAAVVAAVRERGPAIGMDDVAASSGVSKQVFYRYFTDKADLFCAVGREVAEGVAVDVLAALEQDPQEGPPPEPRDLVAAGIEAFLRAVEADPDLYRFVLQRPATAAAINDYSAVVGTHVSRVVGDVLRAAGRDSGGAEAWGFAMVGAVRAAAERWLEQPTMSRQALGAYLTDLLWYGGRGVAAPAGTEGLPPSSSQPARG